MFEGWVAEVLATYLGRFINVERDKLRISLWGGESLFDNVGLFGHTTKHDMWDFVFMP